MSRGVLFPCSLLLSRRGFLLLLVILLLYLIAQPPSSASTPDHLAYSDDASEESNAASQGVGVGASFGDGDGDGNGNGNGNGGKGSTARRLSKDLAKMRQSQQIQEHDDLVRHEKDRLNGAWEWMKSAAAGRVKEQLGWGRGSREGAGARPAADGGDLDPETRRLLAYREHLEKEHSPHSYIKHSPTLTFSNIYVLSLPRRSDRRLRMSKIANALGLRFTFVDATHKESPLIGWIAERVREVRDRKRPILAQALKMDEKDVGGAGVDSPWLSGNDSSRLLSFPDLAQLDERWTVKASNPVNAPDSTTRPTFSSQDIADKEYRDDEALESLLGGRRAVDWVQYLEEGQYLDRLAPSGASDKFKTLDDYVADLLHDPVEQLKARQVNAGVLATWYSQTRVWRKMLENSDKSALILEDDVDIEWDFERQWPNIERALPRNWEIVFLGHCWGKELASAFPPLFFLCWPIIRHHPLSSALTPISSP